MRRIPFIRTDAMEDLFFIVLLIPLWWILGVKFLIFHVLTAAILIKWFFRSKQAGASRNIPPEVYPLAFFVGLYGLSLAVNSGNIPFSRIIASLNNLSFWFLGLALMFIVFNAVNRKNILTFLRSFPVFGVMTSFFVLPAFIFGLFTHRVVKLDSVLLKLLPEKWMAVIYEKALLLKSSLVLNIVGEDKLFQKPFPRSPGFNIYGTALGLTMIIVIILTLVYFRFRGKKKWLVPVIVLEAAVLLLSLSRTSILGFLVASGLVFFLAYIKKSALIKVVPILLVVLIVVLIFVPPQKILDTVSDFRKGSTIWRGKLYEMTIRQAMEKPVLGHGFKPRIEDFPLPLGSHSTFIGVLYKTGFLGLLAFCLFWILVLRKWWIQKKICEEDRLLCSVWGLLGTALISGIFWMVTEDLDAPPLAAFLYFIVIGLSLSINKLKTSMDQK